MANRKSNKQVKAMLEDVAGIEFRDFSDDRLPGGYEAYYPIEMDMDMLVSLDANGNRLAVCKG